MPCEGDNQDWWVISEQNQPLISQETLINEPELAGMSWTGSISNHTTHTGLIVFNVRAQYGQW